MHLLKEVQEQFASRFGNHTYCIGVSGRANMIGEHTDYNDGFVFPFSIDKKIYFLANENEHFDLIALDLNENYSDESLYQKGSWQYFFKECLHTLTSKYGPLKPLNIVFGGDLPIGSGISSSSALCCGFIKLFNHFNELNISKLDQVHLASEIEHGSGVKGGKMDQYAIVFGEKDNAILLDCKTLQHQKVVTPSDWNFFLLHSGVSHNLVDTEYNIRRAQCASAVKKLSAHIPTIHSLRDLNKEIYDAYNFTLNEIEKKRASFVIEENERVLSFKETLQKNDISKAGHLLNASHAGLSNKYEVSCTELDTLHQLAYQVKEIVGSRMMGGGFGGCTINLVRGSIPFDEIEKKVMFPFHNIFGYQPKLIELHLDDGIKEYL
jgi:galactokinase